MNAPRSTLDGYIQFLLASPTSYTTTEAARVQPDTPNAPAHDSYTRLLNRLEPDPQTLWDQTRPLVDRTAGILILDDTVLDKPHARHMGLVAPFWSGRHTRVVRGINLVSLVWTDGDRIYPTDYRLVNPATCPKQTKNDLFAELVRTAHARVPAAVCVLRFVVLGQGQPQGNSGVWVDVFDPGAVQPAGEPRSNRQPADRGVRSPRRERSSIWKGSVW